MPAKILVIEDDAKLAELMQLWLEQAGFACEWCDNGASGLRKASAWLPDLVILDLALPTLDGWQVCRRLREAGQVAIIMATARGEEVDRVRGLKLGADDYVVKPFSFPELVARVEAVLRRTGDPARHVHPAILRRGGLEIHVDAHKVWLDGQEIHLTPTEFRLLAHLAGHQGQVLTHRQILQTVWGPAYGDDLDSLRMCIRSLRQKIEIPTGSGATSHRYISTEYGIGYRFD